jgi:uncharacterized repeat protein (TIGR03803 family)
MQYRESRRRVGVGESVLFSVLTFVVLFAPFAFAGLELPSLGMSAGGIGATGLGDPREDRDELRRSPGIEQLVVPSAHKREQLVHAAVRLSNEPDAASPTTITDSVFEVLYAFSGGSDGASPNNPLIQSSDDGQLYGTTRLGGDACLDSLNTLGCGTVFRLAPDGSGYTLLHAFTGGADGENPSALTQGEDGNFYGTTGVGGSTINCFRGCGTVFQMTPDGSVTTLYSFTGGSDGSGPWAALLKAVDGTFYGTTSYGGLGGTVFNVTPDGTLTTLHTFNGLDGSHPLAPLIQAADGNFYGTTTTGIAGPPRRGGTVFQMTPDGAVTVLHVFEVGLPDERPAEKSGLVQTDDGNFYGTSGCSSVSGGGYVYQIAPDFSFRLVHSFTGGGDGLCPVSELIPAVDGNLYGTTRAGGNPPDCSIGCGTVFQIIPGIVVTTVYQFTGRDDGANPEAALLQGNDGSFYGTATRGEGSAGVVFRLTLGDAVSGVRARLLGKSFQSDYRLLTPAVTRASVLRYVPSLSRSDERLIMRRADRS